MQYRAGKGSTEVVLSDEIARMIDGTLAKTIPRTSATLQRALSWIEVGAQLRWPVSKARKSHSRDEMASAVRIVDPDTIDGIVRNDADYAYYIKSEQNGLAGQSPFQVLIRKPLKEAEKAIANEVAEDLVALMNRGGR